jgi:hypothetical protein
MTILNGWSENRPEGMVIMSDTSGKSSTKKNPCGWINARTLDLSVDNNGKFNNLTDVNTWQNLMLQYAQSCILAAQKVKGRSVVFWDWDHGTPSPVAPYYHSTSLVGDPISPSPEWNGLDGTPYGFADTFFKSIIDGGFGVGMCVRHTLVLPGAPCHLNPASIVDLFQTRAKFCVDRWLAETIYWDSNVSFNPADNTGLIPANYCTYLGNQTTFPNTLAVFEKYNAQHANYGLLWYEPTAASVTVTPPLAGGWPPYTRFLLRINSFPASRDSEVVAAVKAGHKLIFDGANPNNSLNTRVANIYASAGE